jgi:hypothetical protein
MTRNADPHNPDSRIQELLNRLDSAHGGGDECAVGYLSFELGGAYASTRPYPEAASFHTSARAAYVALGLPEKVASCDMNLGPRRVCRPRLARTSRHLQRQPQHRLPSQGPI